MSENNKKIDLQCTLDTLIEVESDILDSVRELCDACDVQSLIDRLCFALQEETARITHNHQSSTLNEVAISVMREVNMTTSLILHLTKIRELQWRKRELKEDLSEWGSPTRLMKMENEK